ncbi:MAG: hypothetical protein IT383_07145 [Deltaproteobacteria bacterium]|nr:hypothetical protein [Deltaproteobacteria bacterium]
MTLDPWVIEQLEEEARRRDEEASRSHRIELPQTRPAAEQSNESDPEAAARVAVVDLSPSGGAAFDL